MEMIKQQEAARKLKEAVCKQYNGVEFGAYFGAFLEALEQQDLVERIERKKISEGIEWTNEVTDDGIRIVTDVHPMINQGKVNVLEVTGSKYMLQQFDALLQRYAKAQQSKTILVEDSKHHKHHDELNPKFWIQDKLRTNIRKSLLRIAEDFEDYIDIPGLKVTDVILTGSNANYNWTEYSDLDVHLMVDMKEAEEKFGSTVRQLFDAKRWIWNKIRNVTVQDQDVEVYVQDEDEDHTSTGIYSLTDNKWLVKPDRTTAPTVDDKMVKQKYEEFKKQINSISKCCNKASEIEALMKKIVKARKAGLADNGEFSVENLAFKMLRNEGLLDKLVDAQYQATDRELSFEEEELTILRS